MRYCAAAGYPECKRRAVTIVLGITHSARRLLGANNPDLASLQRACHGPDISRVPHSLRQSAKETARRAICGSPGCEALRDFWPGTTELKRPPSERNAAQPQAEPSELMSDRVAEPDAYLGLRGNWKPGLSEGEVCPHASKGDSGQYATDPPMPVERRFRGLAEAPVPPAKGFPLCAMGLLRGGAVLVSDEMEPAPWRDLEFEMRCRRYGAQYLAVWHALFELFVLIERVLRPAYRLLLRERASAIRQDNGVEIGPGATRVTLEAALKVIPCLASAEEMGSLMRAYVVEVPGALIRAIGLRPALLGRAGPGVVGPLGVLSGMSFASVARASYSSRVMRFRDIHWNRLSRVLRGFPPAPPPLGVSDEKSPKGLEAVVDNEAFEGLRRRSGSRMGRQSARALASIRR